MYLLVKVGVRLLVCSNLASLRSIQTRKLFLDCEGMRVCEVHEISYENLMLNDSPIGQRYVSHCLLAFRVLRATKRAAAILQTFP